MDPTGLGTDPGQHGKRLENQRPEDIGVRNGYRRDRPKPIVNERFEYRRRVRAKFIKKIERAKSAGTGHWGGVAADSEAL